MANLAIKHFPEMGTKATIFHGDLNYARHTEQIHDGQLRRHSEEGVYLLKAAALYTLALPILFIKSADATKSTTWSYLRGKEDLDTNKTRLYKEVTDLTVALKRATTCSLKGALKLTLFPVDIIRSLGATLYQKVFPTTYGVVVVDMQPGFTPGGEATRVLGHKGESSEQETYANGGLPVTGALETIKATDQLLNAKKHRVPVFVTADHHPANHVSFQSQHKRGDGSDVETLDTAHVVLDDAQDETQNTHQTPVFPEHCVAGTESARPIYAKQADTIIRKGTVSYSESFGGFVSNDGRVQTIFQKMLKRLGLRPNEGNTLILTGVATNFCVQKTAEQALKAGYNVRIVTETVRGLGNTQEEVNRKTLEALQETATTVRQKKGVTVTAEFISLEKALELDAFKQEKTKA